MRKVLCLFRNKFGLSFKINLMKNLHVITAVIIFSTCLLSVHAQNDSIASVSSNEQFYYNNSDFGDFPYVRIGVGVWLPQGKLSEVIAPSPMFEFALDFPSGSGLRSVAFAMQFILPNQRRDFVYNTDAGTFTASSNLILNGLLKFKKPVYTNGSNSIEIGAGLGISAMFISENDIDFKDVIPYESANTILFMPGVSWYHVFKDDAVLTLGTDLHIAPYGVQGATQSAIGSISLIPKVTYRF